MQTGFNAKARSVDGINNLTNGGSLAEVHHRLGPRAVGDHDGPTFDAKAAIELRQFDIVTKATLTQFKRQLSQAERCLVLRCHTS